MVLVVVLDVGLVAQPVGHSQSIQRFPVLGHDSSTEVVGTDNPVSTASCSVVCCSVDSTSCYCSVGTLLSSAQQVCPHSLDTDRSAARPWVVGCIVEVLVHRFGCNFEFERIVLADEEGAAGDGLQSDVGAGVAMAHLMMSSNFFDCHPLILLGIVLDHACLTSGAQKNAGWAHV